MTTAAADRSLRLRENWAEKKSAFVCQTTVICVKLLKCQQDATEQTKLILWSPFHESIASLV